MDPAEQGFGPYLFAGNNPIIYIDKDGKWFIIDDFIFGFIRGLIRGEPPFKTGFKLASNLTKVWSTMFRGNFWQIVTKWTWALPAITHLGIYLLRGNWNTKYRICRD